jgi:hypothetical protein
MKHQEAIHNIFSKTAVSKFFYSEASLMLIKMFRVPPTIFKTEAVKI